MSRGGAGPRARGWLRAVALLVALMTAAGCASVPSSSPVQVLRRVSEGEYPMTPPGPAENANPLDLVRGFINASGAPADRHAAARRFLTPEAESAWDDSTGITVLDGLFNTVYPEKVPGPDAQSTTVRIIGTGVGRLTVTGAFEPDQFPFEVDVGLVRHNGQWRINQLPDGVVAELSVLREHFRPVRIWFVDPVRHTVVADLRYLPMAPARAQASWVIDRLLAGPSAALAGAAISQIPPTARLRANVVEAPDGAVVVDLTQIGELDVPARQLLAAQVVLSLAEVNVARVRLLVDGEPLLAGRPDLTREDVAGLVAEMQPGAEVAGLVVSGGRLRQLTGAEPGTPLPGPAGNGELDVQSAALTADGRGLAVVARSGGMRRLYVGGAAEGGVTPTNLEGSVMTRPTWSPDGREVWTVLNNTRVTRVLVDNGRPVRMGPVDASELTALGPIQDLRLSRDGLRVAAVVAETLYTAAVVRTVDGEVTLRNIRRLRPADLDRVVAVDWRNTDTLVVVSALAEGPVSQVSIDGLDWQLVSPHNLTPPLTAVAAAPGRPLLVSDQNGVWSFSGHGAQTWRQVVGASPAVPLYPG